MKQFFTLLILLFSLSEYKAQIVFEKRFDAVPRQYGRDVFQTPDHGYLIQVTIETPYRHCLIIKTDSLGDTLWTRTFGTDSIQYYVYDIANTTDGGYVMTGDYQTIPTFPSMDSYVHKIDSAGNTVWFNLFGWTFAQGGSKDHGQKVTVGSDSITVVAGATKDIYLSPGNYLGGLVFNAYISTHEPDSGGLMSIASIGTKLDTNYYLNYYNTIDIETIGEHIYWLGYRSDVNNNTDTLLVKMNYMVDTIFTIQHGLSQYKGLSRTSDEHLLLFGPGIISKMDTLGNIVWTSNNASASFPHEFIELEDGRLASIGGTQYVSPYFADYYGVYNQIVYINKYSSAGILQHSELHTPQFGNQNELGYRITECHDGGFAFAGYSDDKAWLVKTDSLGNFNTSVIDYTTPGINITVFPNPAQDDFNIHWSQPVVDGTLVIRNSMGQIVWQEAQLQGVSQSLHTELAPGVYILEISDSQGMKGSARLVVGM